jgi:Heterokaryon incompatibility protein (HET)
VANYVMPGVSLLTTLRFRWTALQMEQLKVLRPMKPSTIREALRTLPKDLDETYENILEKINPLNSKEALSVLRWISFATRPLFIEELIEVCAINLEADPEFETEERYKPSDILDVLPGLITINPPLKVAEQPLYKTHVVTFSHFSVQEYLLGQRIVSSPASFYSLEIQFSNHFIAACCLAYLHCCNSFELRKDDFPLRQYAWDYWAWHTVCEIGKSNQELSDDAETLFSSIAHQPDGLAKDALKNLTSKFVSIKIWRYPASSLNRTFEMCLKVPFFLDEFESTSWKDVSFPTDSTSLLYEYQPLGQTGSCLRLIELFPSSKRYTEVRCRLFHTDLASNPTYDGASYYWGGRKTSYVRLNGLLREVHQGLVTDLRNLRPSEGESSRFLFVDALSFDHWSEGDKAEQFERVHLTPRIFKQAQQVAIGLGDRDEADASAIEFVRNIASMSRPDADISQSVKQWPINDPGWADFIGASVLHLFQRHCKYWRRYPFF